MASAGLEVATLAREMVSVPSAVASVKVASMLPAAPPERRFEAIRRLSEAGIPTGVIAGPRG